ncbi:uncharacterized protein BX664DRAFT_327539 [Halteromyces radiatus]|uniref:uncharacterized protein n=1 Tax=Halteromyces radiatus TaxID=101107 RepID=UPI0022203792|nr:uncharacterized protein BX664DRAFT_327539 [Halteromyces radiatus]KAI8092537.1 hypothetical protein BX664DRAFT_327539 [Halteromyces radiatus]
MSTSLWSNSHDNMTLSYKKIIKHLAAQAPKVYGDIPPRKQNKKKKKKKKQVTQPPVSIPAPVSRRMSHVEDWIVVDSKESLPDEEDLVQRSPLRNFLSIDFLSDVLPLHTPPASLSDPSSLDQQNEIAALADRLKATRIPRTPTSLDTSQQVVTNNNRPPLVRRHSISTTTNAQTPSLSTTASCVLSEAGISPPDDHLQQVRWVQTISRLRRSLASIRKKKPEHLIPMPPPPPKPANQRRRSEATTQPRFNADTNTYKRDTRYNSDHLRMIACELNMMRNRKLISPLRPRGFLPRRKDVVYLGKDRRRSPLMNEIFVDL